MTYTITPVFRQEPGLVGWDPPGVFVCAVQVKAGDGTIVLDGEAIVRVADEAAAIADVEQHYLPDMRRNMPGLASLVLPGDAPVEVGEGE